MKAVFFNTVQMDDRNFGRMGIEKFLYIIAVQYKMSAIQADR